MEAQSLLIGVYTIIVAIFHSGGQSTGGLTVGTSTQRALQRVQTGKYLKPAFKLEVHRSVTRTQSRLTPVKPVCLQIEQTTGEIGEVGGDQAHLSL